MRIALAIGAVAVAVLGFGSPAVAHPTPTAPYNAVLHDPHHNTQADDFENKCDEWDGSVPAGKEGWAFNSQNDKWDQAVGLKVTFSTPGGDVIILIKTASPDAATYPQGFAPAANPNKAIVLVPAGWTLKDAEGAFVDEVGKTEGTTFVVTHTCAGTPSSESPSPSPSTSESESSSPSASTSTDPGLPRTGTKITGIVLSGLGAVAVGGAILLVLRRRRDALLSTPEE